MNKVYANLIIAACLLAAAGIMVYTWIIAPIIVYGMVGLLGVGMVYGGYMNRAYIRTEIDRVVTKWKMDQLKEEE